MCTIKASQSQTTLCKAQRSCANIYCVEGLAQTNRSPPMLRAKECCAEKDEKRREKWSQGKVMKSQEKQRQRQTERRRYYAQVHWVFAIRCVPPASCSNYDGKSSERRSAFLFIFRERQAQVPTRCSLILSFSETHFPSSRFCDSFTVVSRVFTNCFDCFLNGESVTERQQPDEWHNFNHIKIKNQFK